MRPRRFTGFTPTILFAFPIVAAAQQGATPLPRVEPLTRGRGTALVANADSLADDVGRFIEHPRTAHDEAILDDVRGVMAATSEWRWYYRDHGLMVAVPVRERLAFGTRRNAEALIATTIQRVVYEQGMGSPPVQVVFIEPEVPCHGPVLRLNTFADGFGGRTANGLSGLYGMGREGNCGCR